MYLISLTSFSSPFPLSSLFFFSLFNTYTLLSAHPQSIHSLILTEDCQFMSQYTISTTNSLKDDIIPFQELSNYALSIHDTYPDNLSQRRIQSGDSETRIKQLNQQIEQLSHSNARLTRANRLLKLDFDRMMDEKTDELKQALKLMIEQNIRLQRTNKLLQYDYDIKAQELNNIKYDEMKKMKNVGPEYEYLVQMIHLLYKQISGNTSCDDICCYTDKPPTILPVIDQHICRPVIESHIPSGSMVSRLEHENNKLRDSMNILLNDRDALYQLLEDKEKDNETLKHELSIKDDIVQQLEKDFDKMEIEIVNLQKDWCHCRDTV
ncbi:hypothetical protein BDB01DRAFT_779253 [Pilobolus umbonatus]|nr:hypothetical protein BDB01DRAFT_779253 [Pilobolus umbonatus]